ncbi:ELWxxDGT repeat protein [Myxococcus sp. Y35]|uniref:ELWxxDGT repeat protein n=1 Tax=Pseudomyxococcus flavus TaxID=3115648 RepID=UPI003CE7F9F1
MAFRGKLFFSAIDFEASRGALWRSEGTTASTRPVKRLVDPPGRLTVVGKKLFFTGGFSEEHGNELWVSDGTMAGTRLVKELSPESGSAFLENFIAVGDSLYFFRVVRPAIIVSGNLELWRSDGTTAGTVRVKDLGPEDATNGPLDLESVGNRLFMSFGTTETGTELWVSDGSAAGTHLVKDIQPGPGSSFPFNLTQAAGVLYFSADDGEHGRELWRSDGTAQGTELVEDTRPGPEGSGAQPFTVFKKRLYFATFTPDYSETELRKLDPDPSCHPRSHRVATIPNPYADEPREFFIFVSSSTVTERKLYFTLFYDVGSPAPADVQLWRTDGTEQGTKLLYQPLIVSPDLRVPTPVPTNDGRVVFYAFDEAHGHELWVSNGQPSGTRLLQDIRPGPASSYPQDLIRAGDFIYFTALDDVHGREIWVLPLGCDADGRSAAGKACLAEQGGLVTMPR